MPKRKSPSTEPLALIRKNRNMTREELARKSGVPYDTIANWEQGTRNPARGQAWAVCKVARALKVQPEDLFPGE